jgi:DnaJ-class molecular chaperone
LSRVLEQLRTIYEQYGAETLRSGVIGPDQVRRGGYNYQQNCYEIFEKFFLEQNAFADIIDTKGTQIEGSYFGTAPGGLNEVLPEAMPDITTTVSCSLKDLYCGVRKTVYFDRQVVGLDGRTTNTVKASEEVFVRPGMQDGAKFFLAGKGHQTPRRQPSDLHVQLASETESCENY